jgi:hypothetical protein
MESSLHQANDRRETQEIITFSREEWMYFKERDDAVRQVRQSSHAEARHILTMVVRTAIDRDRTTIEITS